MLPDPAPEPGIKLHDTAPEPDIQSSKQLPFDNNDEISITFSFDLRLFADKLAEPNVEITNPNEPRKKKYAKEAWPGRKPLFSGL